MGLFTRLEAGIPAVLDGGVRGALERVGFEVDGGLATAAVLGGQVQALTAIHQRFAAAGVHVLRTNTAQTTPDALQRAGYGYRSAKLSSLAVDSALEAVEASARALLVAGVMPADFGARGANDARLRSEQGAHAQRLAAAGCDLLFVERAGSLREAVAATVAALQTGLPVLVSLCVGESGRLLDGEPLDVVCGALAGAGARGFLAVPSEPVGEMRAVSVLAGLGRPWGVWHGGPGVLSPAAYARRAAELVAEGATLLSGEDMVTPEHVLALLDEVPAAQRELRRPSAFPMAVGLRGFSNLPPRV
jgi:homocysteine S-methyltransferase